MIHDLNEHYGLEGDPLVPYDRYVAPDGRIVRVETDNNGNLVEFVEGTREPREYGLQIGKSWAMRETLVSRQAELGNAHLSKPEIAELVMDRLRKGPSTADDLAEQIGVWKHQMQHAMGSLRKQKKVTCRPDPVVGFRKYVWSLNGADG